MPLINRDYIKRQWNKIMFMHFFAGFMHSLAVGLTIYFTKGESTIPITTYFPDSNFEPDMQHYHNLPSGYLTIGYSLPSALEHIISFILLCSTYYTDYTDYLSNNADVIRWISYSISAPIMMVQIATRCGVFDPVLLTSIALLYCTMMTFGFLTEHMLLKDRGQHTSYATLPLYLGWLPFFGSWAIVFTFFFRATSRGSPPAFVYVIVVGEFFIMCLFGFVLMFAVSKQKDLNNKPIYATQLFVTRIVMMYIVLSLTAKLFLAILNWYGSQTM